MYWLADLQIFAGTCRNRLSQAKSVNRKMLCKKIAFYHSLQSESLSSTDRLLVTSQWLHSDRLWPASQLASHRSSTTSRFTPLKGDRFNYFRLKLTKIVFYLNSFLYLKRSSRLGICRHSIWDNRRYWRNSKKISQEKQTNSNCSVRKY